MPTASSSRRAAASAVLPGRARPGERALAISRGQKRAVACVAVSANMQNNFRRGCAEAPSSPKPCRARVRRNTGTRSSSIRRPSAAPAWCCSRRPACFGTCPRGGTGAGPDHHAGGRRDGQLLRHGCRDRRGRQLHRLHSAPRSVYQTQLALVLRFGEPRASSTSPAQRQDPADRQRFLSSTSGHPRPR